MNGMFKSISLLYTIEPGEACSVLCAAVRSAKIVAAKAVSIILFA